MTAAPRIVCHLRRIVWPADLRYSEESLVADLEPSWVAELGPRDVIAFVGSTGSQVRFVFRPLHVGETRGSVLHPSRARIAWTSVRARLNVGAFNPERLADYAIEAGIELTGLTTFEKRYAYLKEETNR